MPSYAGVDSFEGMTKPGTLYQNVEFTLGFISYVASTMPSQSKSCWFMDSAGLIRRAGWRVLEITRP